LLLLDRFVLLDVVQLVMETGEPGVQCGDVGVVLEHQPLQLLSPFLFLNERETNSSVKDKC
jgi:hypothetical protein